MECHSFLTNTNSNLQNEQNCRCSAFRETSAVVPKITWFYKVFRDCLWCFTDGAWKRIPSVCKLVLLGVKYHQTEGCCILPFHTKIITFFPDSISRMF